ncbi:hypothetical protein [Arthrobacter sp. U41]|uniref:hypothetical protein n=1 Tax=Arthrobacter sp. U41 TaxID=1849032 RepID=UPI0012FC787B|nr:hypothetical protein [Arthrobacter sp. U41]
MQAVLLGRCFSRGGYKVVATAQSQAIARRIFLEMANSLKAAYPDEEFRPFQIRIGNGQESIQWDNGSMWWIVAPRASSYRSQSADVLLFDEAGEYSAEQTEDLIEGALPLGDTRPHFQVIVSGTPPKTREGMLWKFLVEARAGKRRYGIVDFSMSPEDDPTSEATWYRVHAGLACGLTDIEVIRERFEGMSLQSFMREYLCADPSASNLRAIDAEDWSATQVAELLALPGSGFSAAFDVAPDGSSAALAIAWYNEQGTPCVQLLAHKAGYSWLPVELAKLLKLHRGLPVIYDRIGNNLAVVQEMQKKRGISLTGMESIGAAQVSAGVTILMAALSDRNLIHAKDASLDNAVEGANFRYVNDARLFGRRSSTEDVSPLVAISNALYHAAGQRTRSNNRPKSRINR